MKYLDTVWITGISSIQTYSACLYLLSVMYLFLKVYARFVNEAEYLGEPGSYLYFQAISNRSNYHTGRQQHIIGVSPEKS